MGALTTAADVARASHPAPAVLVTAASAAWLRAHRVPVVPAAGAVLAGQLSTGWLNDAVDARRDAAAGRVTKPVGQGRLGAGAVARAAVAAAVASVALGRRAAGPGGRWHDAALASAWAYDLGVKGTWASPLPYAVSFGLLPRFLAAAAGRPAVARLVAGTSALGVGAHLANALPDLEVDAAAGLRSAPVRLGRWGTTAGAALAVQAAGATLLGTREVRARRVLAGGGAVLLAALAHGRRTPTSRLPFLAVLVVAGADVATLLVGPADGVRRTQPSATPPVRRPARPADNLHR